MDAQPPTADPMFCSCGSAGEAVLCEACRVTLLRMAVEENNAAVERDEWIGRYTALREAVEGLLRELNEAQPFAVTHKGLGQCLEDQRRGLTRALHEGHP